MSNKASIQTLKATNPNTGEEVAVYPRTTLKAIVDEEGKSLHLDESYITNAFSEVQVGDTIVKSNSPLSALKLESGDNVTITSNADDRSIKIESHPTIDTVVGLQDALDSKLDTSLKGTASGIAELDENGKVLASQLPSYVDDVLEYDDTSKFPTTGESGKIYTDLSTNKTYRWGGSSYVEISPSLALGETTSTAYRGDRGKIAYDHSQTAHAPSDAQANVVETIKVNGTALTPDDSKTVNINVDDAFSAESTNPIQNKVVANALNGATIKNTFIPTSTLKEYLLSVSSNSINNGYVWNPLSDFPRTDVTKWYVEVIKPHTELIYAKVIAICTRTNDLYIGSADEEGNISWSDRVATQKEVTELSSRVDNSTTRAISLYQPESLEVIAQTVTSYPSGSTFKTKDVNNLLGLGANQWMNFDAFYQNPYSENNTYDVNITLLVYKSGGTNTPYVIYLDGNYATGISVKAKVQLATTDALLLGFAERLSGQTWGNQVGTFITGFGDSNGCIAFRRDNPEAGRVSMVLDGTVYVNEGADAVATIKSTLSSNIITTATDFNNIQTTGVYHINVGGCSNVPCGNWGTLYVDFSVGTKYQIYIPDGDSTVMYKRKYSGGWGSWITCEFIQKETASGIVNTHHGTNGGRVPTLDFLSYWNGAYSSNNNSNLAYCNKGAFGNMAIKSATLSGTTLTITG